MKLIIGMFILGLLSIPCAYGDEVVTRSNGDKVILFDDGTWKKYSFSGDSNKQNDDICKDYTEEIVDKISGVSYLASKNQISINNGDNQAEISLAKSNKRGSSISIKLFSDDNCIDSNTRVFFYFADGYINEINPSRRFNCDGNILLFLSGEPELFVDKLKTNPVSSIRIVTKNSDTDNALDEKSSKLLIETAKCLFK